MPRYFIDTSDGQRPLIDNVGQEFPDAEAARRAALDALPDMARDELRSQDFRSFRARHQRQGYLQRQADA